MTKDSSNSARFQVHGEFQDGRGHLCWEGTSAEWDLLEPFTCEECEFEFSEEDLDDFTSPKPEPYRDPCEHGYSHCGLCPSCNSSGMACTPSVELPTKSESFEEAVRACFEHWVKTDPDVQGLRPGHVGEIVALYRNHHIDNNAVSSNAELIKLYEEEISKYRLRINELENKARPDWTCDTCKNITSQRPEVVWGYWKFCNFMCARRGVIGGDPPRLETPPEEAITPTNEEDDMTRTRSNTLSVEWSSCEKDLIFYHPDGPQTKSDGRFLHNRFDNPPFDYDGEARTYFR